MKLPEPAPNWYEIFKNLDTKELVSILKDKNLSGILEKANNKYLYWDDYKHLPFPQNISIEVAWACLKFLRTERQKLLPAQDKTGINFSYWLTDRTLMELSFIDRNAGAQIFSEKQIPEAQKERYLISSIMEEAISSSLLEGAATTRAKAKQMLRSGKKPETIADHMIKNNYETILHLKDIKDQPLTSELIIKIQAMLTKKTIDDPDKIGKFRSTDDINVIDRRDGQVLFVPPKEIEIQERIERLCEYVNTKQENEFTHPIIKGIIIHFWLAYIHPFSDGNGRTARALFYWYLLKNDYWLFEYFSISSIVRKAPAQYARAYLYSEIDGSDINYFITYNLKAIHLAIDAFWLYIKERQKKLDESLSTVQRIFPDLNNRQSEIIRSAVSNPHTQYTFKLLKNMYNVVYETARKDLMGLAKKGFFIKKRIGREFYFIPAPDIASKLRKY